MNRKNQNRPNNPHNLRKAVFLRRGFALYSAAVATCSLAMPALAATTDPLAVIGNLNSFIFSVIRAVGLILQLAVLLIPPLQEVFDVTSLNATEWAVVICLAFVPLVTSEIVKAVRKAV